MEQQELQTFDLVPGYDYGSGRLCSLTIRMSGALDHNGGARISVRRLHRWDSELSARSLSTGWHLFEDSGTDELSYQCSPDDTDRLNFMLEDLQRTQEWQNQSKLVHQLQSDLYCADQKRDVIDLLMQVEKDSEEIFTRIFKKRFQELLEEKNI